MVPDVVLWQSLLGACKTHGNVEMAEMASRKLVEMGSHSSGDFVLLSNVYAAQLRWHDVGRVREAMKIRDVRKVPGFSLGSFFGEENNSRIFAILVFITVHAHCSRRIKFVFCNFVFC